MAIDLQGGFRFNLLPPKPKEEVALEVEREDSITYAFVLIFIAAIIYLGLVLVGTLLTGPRLQAAQSAIDSRTAQVKSYAPIQALHGELYVKTQTLKPVLDLDIDSSEIFRVADALVAGSTALQVSNYGREKTGVFVFQVVSPTFADVVALADKASKIDGVSDVFIRGIVLNSSRTSVTTTIALNINAIQSTTTKN